VAVSRPSGSAITGLDSAGLSVYQLVFFAVFGCYSVLSFLNSSMVGTKAEDVQRTGVYFALVGVMAMMAAYILTTRAVPAKSPIVGWLVAIGLAIALSNIIQGQFSWTAAVHLGMITWWVLTMLFFSRLAYWKPQSTRNLVTIFTLAFYVYVFASWIAAQRIGTTYSIVNPVINAVYFVVACAPFVLLAKHTFARYVGVATLLISVAISFKRGAIVATALMLLVVLWTVKRNDRVRSRVAPLVFLPLLLWLGYSLADWFSGGYLSVRFSIEELQDGSGRGRIYDVLWRSVREANVLELFFGRGSEGTTALVDTGAHNQWLEVLVNFGLLGLVAYFGLIVALIRTALVATRDQARLNLAVCAVVTYLVVVGFYSGTLFVHQTFYATAMLGLWHGEHAAAHTEAPLGGRGGRL